MLLLSSWEVKPDHDLDVLNLFMMTLIHILRSHIHAPCRSQSPSHSQSPCRHSPSPCHHNLSPCLNRSRSRCLSRSPPNIHHSTSHPGAPLQNNKGRLQKINDMVNMENVIFHMYRYFNLPPKISGHQSSSPELSISMV